MARQREALPHLNIPQRLNMQQHMGPAPYSPSLSSALPMGYYPSYPNGPNGMHSPMLPIFPPTSLPGRPSHHAVRPSLIQPPSIGLQANAFLSPVVAAGRFPPTSPMLGPGQQFGNHVPSLQPFPHRNRRQLSIGGPPKAILGGPSRKHTPLSANTLGGQQSPVPAPKAKKIIVNLPKETVKGQDAQPQSRPTWARTPVDISAFPDLRVIPVYPVTAEEYPPPSYRAMLPDVIDVYLPGKKAWDELKIRVIEDRLEKLGVEYASEDKEFPHIYAPHARAASVSYFADPALLLYKLNKLRQSQVTSYIDSPPRSAPFSPSINGGSDGSRHGYTMSLSHPPSHQPAFHDASSMNFNPFGPHAIFGSDYTIDGARSEAAMSLSDISSPVPSLFHRNSAPQPLSAFHQDSRPNFARGFGLDITEEEDEKEDEDENPVGARRGQGATEDLSSDGGTDMDLEEIDGESLGQLPELRSSATSRYHSRHVSRLSAALSLRSVGGAGAMRSEEKDQLDNDSGVEMPTNVRREDDLEDCVGEWTGSEDGEPGTEVSFDESLGEFSNPSDEERARQQRADRRLRRRAMVQQRVDKPRRLPNFPRPPTHTHMDDEIISNPSEEGTRYSGESMCLGAVTGDCSSSSPSNVNNAPSSSLPQPPHSRIQSGQHSVQDRVQPHARRHSDHSSVAGNHQRRVSSISLNPFAKPFVFGQVLQTSTSRSTFGAPIPPNARVMGHSRLPSLGKPLNVSAPEFKPSGSFARRAAGGVRSKLQPEPAATPFQLPPPKEDVEELTSFKPSKRQRRGSTASLEEGDSMMTFKFPTESHHEDNDAAEPFTFAGFSAVAKLPQLAQAETVEESTLPLADQTEETLLDDAAAKEKTNETGETGEQDSRTPSTTKVKRAPLPLDFKHPVTVKSVPAGLFKALVNGNEDRARRPGRSRLNSREIFEHAQMPSLDDLTVPSISRKMSRPKLVTGPGEQEGFCNDDVFTDVRHTRRRSSLPETLQDEEGSESLGSVDPASTRGDTGRLDAQDIEEVISRLFDAKFASLRNDLLKETNQGGHELTSKAESMIADVVSILRAQLQDSAAQSLENSQMDARGELDFQLIKSLIEDGHKELLSSLQEEWTGVRELAQSRQSASIFAQEMVPIVEQMSNRTVLTIVEALSQPLQDAIRRGVPAHDRDALIEQLLSALNPMIASLRPELIDYEFLTQQLAQAVKPHISQLIDLTSDKRETAGLIVDRIIPLLPVRNTPGLDPDAVMLRIVTEVRRAIAPIDPFEMKEQVADLVVERLDSRLAVRDKSFNIDSVTSKVTEAVSRLLDPVSQLNVSMRKSTDSQEIMTAQQLELVSSRTETSSSLEDLAAKLEVNRDMLRSLARDVTGKLDSAAVLVGANEQHNSYARTAVDNLTENQKAAREQSTELLSLQKDISGRMSSLHDIARGLAENLENLLAYQVDFKNLMVSSSETQTQLAKARTALNQTTATINFLTKKLEVATEENEDLRSKGDEREAEVEKLNAEVEKLHVSASMKAEEQAILDSRNAENENALTKALERLQFSDAALQTNRQEITDLKVVNGQLREEVQSLKSKVDILDLQATFATREKEGTARALEALQQQHSSLVTQQSHWDDLRQTSEKIDKLTSLIGQADNEELNELRHRNKNLEAELAILQKRLKEIEAEVAISEQTATAALQSQARVQQRSDEWEYQREEQIKTLSATLEQSKQRQAQLEESNRLATDRENKLREQVSSLEAEVALPQRGFTRSTTTPVIHRPSSTSLPPLRPVSRASTARSTTPNASLSSYAESSAEPQSSKSDTALQPSVWDSIHAPKGREVRPGFGNGTTGVVVGKYAGGRVGLGRPSTTRRPLYQSFSTNTTAPTYSESVSLVPTMNPDGWWT